MSGWILEIKGSLCDGSALLHSQFLSNFEGYKSSMSSYSPLRMAGDYKVLNLELAIIITLLVFVQD